ncbi:GDP-fucose synthetase [Salegentibacter salinarum]|uniref:GDP-L-fucose synthase n=1 Tax=Salegentibacter salinarum TaxID=447422 RepID=A0A2N0TY44_9FLAO|nr:GDP-L-fucose synthase [Salegentibacter salinarum]PKD19667.1 GDP-fucose synthetase [Salegentibacter salinarum]SKB90837.1 GDP-L-fucose synthase [Salegentibacter salinarum]
MKKNAKIYIAGHTGLVGCAILKQLEFKGFSQIITRTHKELELMDCIAVEEFFREEKPEYVFLAAAKVGGIIANNNYRAEFLYENSMIQNNIIHHSYLNNVKKLMFLGSTCIYPKNCKQPIKEEYLLTGPLEYTNEPYAVAKIAGIKLCESYNLQYGTNFISAMPTNLYGPADNFNLETAHVLPALIRKIYLGKALEEDDWFKIKEDLNSRPIEGINGNAKKTEILSVLEKFGVRIKRAKYQIDNSKKVVSIEIWGTGTPYREFMWSEEMAEACIFLMENRNFQDIVSIQEDNESAIQEVRNTHINIGTGKEVSIAQLAEMTKRIIGFKGEFFFNTEKPDGTYRKLTDISKLEALGWKAQVELDEGIESLYSWYKYSIYKKMESKLKA